MGSPFCTASIVDSRHLVTTASCVFEMSPSSLNVQYGTEDKNNVKFADIVKKVHIHPMYSFYAKVGISPFIYSTVASLHITQTEWSHITQTEFSPRCP